MLWQLADGRQIAKARTAKEGSYQVRTGDRVAKTKALPELPGEKRKKKIKERRLPRLTGNGTRAKNKKFRHAGGGNEKGSFR